MKHTGSLVSTQKAGVAHGYASGNSYASLVLSKLPACFIIILHAALKKNRSKIPMPRSVRGKQNVYNYERHYVNSFEYV